MPRPWRRMSLFGRTAAWMIAALAVIGIIGAQMLATVLPPAPGPVLFDEIVRQLRIPEDRLADGRRPGERGFDGGMPPGMPPPPAGNPPRGVASPVNGSPPVGSGNPPQFDAPPLNGTAPRVDQPPGPQDGGEFTAGPRREFMGPSLPADIIVATVAGRPTAPANSGMVAADAERLLLARTIGIAPAQVVFLASADSHGALPSTPGPRGSAAPAEAPLHGIVLDRSFLAARRLPNDGWRVVERVVDGFPNALQRAVLGFFALALVVLLPLSWLFARSLAVPITRFSEAARRLGNDPQAAPLPREGPAEMLAAVDSFNGMQARLGRLLQERTQMVGAIAHDLRTPLARLAFRLDDLPQPLNDKVFADIQEMKGMISAALDFLRDRSVGDPHERLDFRLLVERVVNDQTDLGHDVTLEDGAPVTVEGSPLALRRAIVNLVENALKYGERARLRLRATQDRCVLEIDDDGPGIPEPLQQRVFEPFFRIEASRNRDTGGIGLGLATVRAIVQDHGGSITLGNRKGGGLKVTVSLALAAA